MLVKAGTSSPAHYSSQFFVHGKLRIQSGPSEVYMKFTDLKYTMYNGPDEKDHDTLELPIRKQTLDLLKPFKVLYNETGNVKALITEEGERQFSRNFKRAIASIFQLEYNKVVNSKHQESFITKEKTIYGKMPVYYNVIPQENEVLKVHKIHEMKSSHHLYQYLISDKEPDYCEVPYEETLSHGSERQYTITKYNEQQVVHDISTTGGYFFNPIKNERMGQYINVNHNFELVGIEKIVERYKIIKEYVDEHLMLHMYDEKDDVIHDIYLGRREYPPKHIVSEIETGIFSISSYIKNNHLEAEAPNYKKGQMVNYLLRVLTVADHDNLMEAWNEMINENEKEISEHNLKIYSQMLPYVGSPASLKFILTLIKEKKVDEMEMRHMIQEMPFFVKAPSDKVLDIMEPLLHLTGI